jgi:hypothetical protein
MLRILSNHYCTCSIFHDTAYSPLYVLSRCANSPALPVRLRTHPCDLQMRERSHCACFSYAQASPSWAQGFQVRDFLQRARFFDVRIQLQRVCFSIARLHLTMREF